MTDEKFVTMERAAELIGCSVRWIKELRKGAWADKVMVGKRRAVFVPLSLVEQYRDHRPRRGPKLGKRRGLAERRARVCQLKQEGWTAIQIAAELGLSYQTAIRDYRLCR